MRVGIKLLAIVVFGFLPYLDGSTYLLVKNRDETYADTTLETFLKKILPVPRMPAPNPRFCPKIGAKCDPNIGCRAPGCYCIRDNTRPGRLRGRCVQATG